MKRISSILLGAVLLAACGSPTPAALPGTPDMTNQTTMNEQSTTTPSTSTTTPPTAPSAPTQPPTALPIDASAPEVRLVRADLPRSAPPALTATEVAALVEGLNTFAVDLYQATSADSEQNLIYSPASIAQAFSMVYAGARGETAAQMTEALRFLPQEDQHTAFNALAQHLDSLDATNTSAAEEGDRFQLRSANAVWGQQGVPFQEDYLTLLAQQYGSGLRVADFAQQSDAVRDEINAWVAEQTADRIAELLPAGMLSANTRMVLVNAIYFNAAWLFPFEESATQDGPFTLLDGSTASTALMNSSSIQAPYAAGAGYQALQLPYAGRTVDMLLLLPDEGNFSAFAEGLSASGLAAIREELAQYDITLTMPRFDVKTPLKLKEVLSAMGMPLPFDAGADFNGMVENGGLFIGEAVHQGTITVDEQGTEAAAATGIAMEDSAFERAEMTVDRPFIFAIIERETGAILFMGHVLNPAQ
ncbi:MAG: serpin family protein [Chloroflexales bacterium]|nr:serpin family protein [Chloroflexales bacterium]